MRNYIAAITALLLAAPAMSQYMPPSSVARGGGSPGGSSGQIEYNSSGSFAGLVPGDLTINGTTLNVTGVNGLTLGNYFASPPAIGGTAPAAGSFSSLTDSGVTGSTQCLQADTSGHLVGAGAPCGTSSNTFPAYISSNWYFPPFSTGVTGAALTLGTIYAAPIWLPVAITVKALSLRLSTAGTSTFQLALYAAGASNYPTGSALCVVTISNTATGNPIGTCSAPVTVGPGVVWEEVNANDTGMACTSFNGNSPLLGYFVGGSSPGTIFSYPQLKQTSAYGTWPTESASGWTANSNANACITYLQAN